MKNNKMKNRGCDIDDKQKIRSRKFVSALLD